MAHPYLNQVQDAIENAIRVKQGILADAALMEHIATAGETLIDAYRQGHKILIAGNGGSAADAQHLAAEFVSRFDYDRPGLPALALTTDSSILTAIGNDYGYEHLFKRQIEANGAPGDIFLGISTSGNSPNIVAALKAARAAGLFALGLTGECGGNMRDSCDLCIRVPSTATPRIQEAHITIGHIWCSLVEQALFPR
jgi:D-sedoheptulose 7-phosphate isomerase